MVRPVDVRARNLVLVLLLIVLASCATNPVQGAYHPLDGQQQNICDGVSPPLGLQLLPADAVLTAALVCTTSTQYIAGEGMWQVEATRKAPAAGIAQLRAALLLPDLAPPKACAAVGYVVPDFVVTLADGSRTRPGLPGDGCNARPLPDTSGWPVAHQTRVKRVMSDAQTRAGCGNAASSPAVWLSGEKTATATGTLAPPTGAVGVCRYHGAGKDDTLVKLGLASAAAFRIAWPTPSRTAPSGCQAATLDGPVGDWLVFSPAPVRPYRADMPNQGEFALVELDGCRRMVSPAKGLVGYLSGAQADRLAALADQSP